MVWIWEHERWPNLHFDRKKVFQVLSEVQSEARSLSARYAALDQEARNIRRVETLIVDAIKTSEIESERIDPQSLRSSVRRRLGFEVLGKKNNTPEVNGIAVPSF